MQFDGKQYFERGPDGATGDSASGRRTRDHIIQMQSQIKGKPDSIDEYKVSDDGKTLTIVSKSIKTNTVFTSVWDKE